MPSMKGHPRRLSRAHSALRESAFRHAAALDLVGTPEAQVLRMKLHRAINDSSLAVDRASTAGLEHLQLKLELAHTNAAFFKMIAGLMAMYELTEPGLHARLPDLEFFTRIDPDGYASALANALWQRGDSLGRELSKRLRAVIDLRFAQVREYERSGAQQLSLQRGKSAVTELKQLIFASEALIHRTVPPGSPIYDVLKKPRKKVARTGSARAEAVKLA